MEIEFKGLLSASASQTEAGYLYILSRTQKDQINLLAFELLEVQGRVPSFLHKKLAQDPPPLALDPIGLRKNLSSAWGALMTEHLLQVHHRIDRDQSDVVAYTAWRYASLTAWAETSAVRELSLDLKISINTVRNRLQLARERGILTSPGSGVRLGR
jgi:hypothetical protein